MSRRTVRWWMAGLLVSAILAGCGGGQPQQGSTPAAQPQPGSAPTAAVQTVTVDGEPVGDQALLDAAKKEGSLTIYTANNTVIEQKMTEAFTKRFGIKVDIVREVGGRLQERILTEAKAGKPLVDVVHQSDLSLLDDLINQGLIAQHKVPVEAKYPQGFKDATGYYYVSIMPLMYIVYNKELVKESEAPKTWKDLLDPKWKGKIGMTHAGIGGTGWSLAYYWRKELGEQFWRDMAAQKPIIYQGAANVTASVIKGEVPVAMNADIVDYIEIIKGAPLASVYPPEGAPAARYGMAVAKQAPRPNAARLFVNWYLSAEGQKLSAQIGGSYSARKDIPGPPGKPPAEKVNAYVPKDPAEFVKLRDEWVKEWNRVFGYR